MAPNSQESRKLKSPNAISSIKDGKLDYTQSSFPGVHTSGKRGTPFPNIFDWLEVKRRDDNIGKYWRVHDKLYNLSEFVSKHPGGRDWIEFTQGTDVTEAFESSHILNFKKVEQLLGKYYVKDATTKRNSPYTFKHDGFYATLKRRVEPVLQEVGNGFSRQALLTEDVLVLAYIVVALLGVSTGSRVLQIVSGILLAMCTVGAHNFFHKKDSWRRFYFDVGPMSSFEWRISHAYSHHLYPNTILDFEVLMAEPLIKYLPSMPKNFIQKHVAVFYSDLLYFVLGISQLIGRGISIAKGKQRLRPENLIILLQLGIFLRIAPTYWHGFSAWILIIMVSSFWFIFVGFQHHHPSCFHDGDEARRDPDFGLCQLDATKGKSDWFHKPFLSILTTFGEHPLHHLFPTVCHSKLKYLKPAFKQTLEDFSEQFPKYTQFELMVGCHQQIGRTESHGLNKKFIK